jgi:hypothetical protein
MPELGTYGSVRGAFSNERPYRNSGAPKCQYLRANSPRKKCAMQNKTICTASAWRHTLHRIYTAAYSQHDKCHSVVWGRKIFAPFCSQASYACRFT